MAGSDLDPADRDLLAEVRDVLETVDPLPDNVRASAQAALTWLTIDAELAALADDSLLAGSGVRGTMAPRSLTFESENGVLAFEITAGDDDTRRIVGQADRAADLTVRHTGSPIPVSTDEHGRFRVEGVRPGPVSLHCVFRDSPDNPIVTSWIVV